jgi:hypothetical protein
LKPWTLGSNWNRKRLAQLRQFNANAYSGTKQNSADKWKPLDYTHYTNKFGTHATTENQENLTKTQPTAGRVHADKDLDPRKTEMHTALEMWKKVHTAAQAMSLKH